ncbi:MAG: hypothetical protein QXP42_00245 [Candidatus Micrarchaeia archaeon]
MRFHKAQAALEYLTTYGWAVMVLIIVIAVLFYIGVLNPSQPLACSFRTPGLSCASYKVTTEGELSLRIGQLTGKTIRVKAIGCTQRDIQPTKENIEGLKDECALSEAEIGGTGIAIQSGSDAEILADTTKLKCCELDSAGAEVVTSGNVGETYKGKIYVYYDEKETKLEHVAIAELSTRYEPE